MPIFHLAVVIVAIAAGVDRKNWRFRIGMVSIDTEASAPSKKPSGAVLRCFTELSK